MAEQSFGPCEAWTTIEQLEYYKQSGADAKIEPQVREDAVEAASNILYVLSGRKFPGVCSTTIRPYVCGCVTTSRCSCGNIDELDLGTNIISITSVKIDGDLLATSAYRVDDYRKLVRIDGDPWPTRQDLSLASTEDDTFEITYRFGRSVPIEGQMAARRLASELARAYSGEKCKLPERVQNLQREGVAMTLIDPFDFLDNGRTGIFEIDLFLATYNPTGSKHRARIVSPDIKPIGRRVNT